MNDRGFTLLEVVVAVLILAVATAATTHLLHLATVAVREADHAERILWEVGRIADSLTAAQARSQGSRLLPDGTRLEWETGGDEVWVRATPPGTDGAWISVPVPLPHDTPSHQAGS